MSSPDRWGVWAHPEMLDDILRLLAERNLCATFFCTHAGIAVSGVMPQSRGPWGKLQLASGGIGKASGQAESLSYPAAQAIAPETEAL